MKDVAIVTVSPACHTLIKNIGKLEKRGIGATVEHLVEEYAKEKKILSPSSIEQKSLESLGVTQ
jgi:hypothetical protein